MKITIIKTIQKINPNAIISVSGDDVNQIEWLENTPVIDKQTILNKQAELQIEEDNRIANEQSAKQSALAKLQALGLTEQEIKSLLGV